MTVNLCIVGSRSEATQFIELPNIKLTSLKHASEVLHRPGIHQVVLIAENSLQAGAAQCRMLRSAGFNKPIAALRQRTHADEVVAFLDAGADDCLSDAMPAHEINARLMALSRRATGHKPRQILEVGDISLRLNRREATCADAAVELRPKEYELLDWFMRHPNMVLERARLIDQLWPEDAVWSNTLDVHIKNLRQKLRLLGSKSAIRTVHGVGYCFEAPRPSP